jgi:hypothetical protein
MIRSPTPREPPRELLPGAAGSEENVRVCRSAESWLPPSELGGELTYVVICRSAESWLPPSELGGELVASSTRPHPSQNQRPSCPALPDRTSVSDNATGSKLCRAKRSSPAYSGSRSSVSSGLTPRAELTITRAGARARNRHQPHPTPQAARTHGAHTLGHVPKGKGK